MKKIYSPYNVWVQFQSGHSLLGGLLDWFRYGKHIKQLCSGLPLYKLEKTQRKLQDQNIILLLQHISTFLSFKPKSTWCLCGRNMLPCSRDTVNPLAQLKE